MMQEYNIVRCIQTFPSTHDKTVQYVYVMLVMCPVVLILFNNPLNSTQTITSVLMQKELIYIAIHQS